MPRSNLQATDEASVITRAAQGDREAYGQLYERYVGKVFRHVYYLTGDPLLAEDLTAQTFLKALEAVHRFELRGVPFLAWLLRIASNLTINYKKGFKNGNGHTHLPEGMDPEGTLLSPEESCEAKANGERIWQSVRQLRGDQRQVIVMRFIDGLSYPEIAQVLSKSTGAVRVTQHRALATLRQLLEDHLGHEKPDSRAG